MRIGVTYSSRDIELQLADDVDRDSLRKQVDEVLGSDDKVLWVTDRRGREVGVPASKIAYVELGSSEAARAMGFSS